MSLHSALAWVFLALLGGVAAYPTGSPDRRDVCARMKPGHTSSPMRGPPPFSINVNHATYYPGDPLTVTIVAEGHFRFKGFMIQARRADWRFNQTEPLGSWVAIPGTQVICQDRRGNALTHTGDEFGSENPKRELQLTWNPPGSVQGHIQFRVTVVSTYEEYWVAENSVIVEDPEAGPIPTRHPPVESGNQSPMVPIDTQLCGKTRGCYREPRGCEEDECEAIVMWEDKGRTVDFQMAGNADGWVALGFSEDKLMGYDSIIECVWNKETSLVEVRASWNEDGTKSNSILAPNAEVGLSGKQGYYSNGRIKCRFTRTKSLQGNPQVFDLDNSYHFLIGKGPVDEQGFKRIHSLEPFKFPMVSPSRINVKDKVNIYSRARYPLVKAHGCLMLIAWMMCGGLAIIMARYYKPMWPNDRFCGQRIWFAVHRGCMVIALICTVIAFILIFIHVGGYSKLPELPAKAHPPIGITVTILVVLNPLIALCRPSTKARHRPIFNWFHWLFGTAAFVLAAPALFIGLSMYKSFVPWWATWVMVAFFLFHIIIELLLEIHGCINGPKQERRNREHELTKKARGDLDGYEPNPVGTRFKTTLISMYLVVMIILGLVMVITVAVC